MCDICLSSPCLPRCPNAPEPPTVYTCDECGEGIREGDEYIDESVKICRDCIENMSAMELLDVLDIGFRTAEAEEPDYDYDD